jgi:type IV secretion system protein TrbB
MVVPLQDTPPDSIQSRARKKLERDFGKDVLKLLNDPQTVEIMLNADGKLWLEQLGKKMRCVGTMHPAQAQAVIETVAGYHGKVITKETPLVEGEFPLDGSRFAGQLPPVVRAPTFAIRKKAISVFTLDHYVSAKIMTASQRDRIVEAIVAHKNILIIGGTGSGKTTLINAIIHHMVSIDPTERVVIIEDTGEIQCGAENHLQYHTSLDVDMTKLLRTSLRMRPDRIFVGEVRGPEALDLLMAWNTGHEGGAATLHANNSLAGLDRLAMLISMHPNAPKPIEPLIASVVHLIVHIARTLSGRRIQDIIEVDGYQKGQYITRSL